MGLDLPSGGAALLSRSPQQAQTAITVPLEKANQIGALAETVASLAESIADRLEGSPPTGAANSTQVPTKPEYAPGLIGAMHRNNDRIEAQLERTTNALNRIASIV